MLLKIVLLQALVRQSLSLAKCARLTCYTFTRVVSFEFAPSSFWPIPVALSTGAKKFQETCKNKKKW